MDSGRIERITELEGWVRSAVKRRPRGKSPRRSGSPHASVHFGAHVLVPVERIVGDPIRLVSRKEDAELATNAHHNKWPSRLFFWAR